MRSSALIQQGGEAALVPSFGPVPFRFLAASIFLKNCRENGELTMDDIVQVVGLRKSFGEIVAVDDISFSVKRGEVFGFLGPNGAGKSTTIKILTTLLAKTSVSAVIDGLDIDKDQNAVRRIIGYSSQEVGVDDDLTGRENLMLQCRFHHLSRERSEENVQPLLETVKLVEAADRRLSTYSGGMRKRLDLASALVSDPKVLFLDEPTTGLDPQSRQDIWEYVKKLNQKGVTIFPTTQYTEEADQLATRLCIVDHGKIVAEGTPKDLKAQIGADVINLRFKEGTAEASQAIMGLVGVKEVGICPADLMGGKRPYGAGTGRRVPGIAAGKGRGWRRGDDRPPHPLRPDPGRGLP
jgi:ABC-2 type transport system ATP-binding protein